MNFVTVKTKQSKQVIDITDLLNKHLKAVEKSEGILHVNVLHTTTALTTADLDPGTDLDILDAFYAMIPKLNYRHPHNPAHVRDHILSALVGTSLSLPFQKSSLLLGTWQKVILLEFDGPRERQLAIKVCNC